MSHAVRLAKRRHMFDTAIAGTFMGKSIKNGSIRRRPILIHEVGLKQVLVEIGLKVIDQGSKAGIGMIVTDLVTDLRPNMFLMVQIRTGNRII